jgi:hypothetical protein
MDSMKKFLFRLMVIIGLLPLLFSYPIYYIVTGKDLIEICMDWYDKTYRSL